MPGPGRVPSGVSRDLPGAPQAGAPPPCLRQDLGSPRRRVAPSHGCLCGRTPEEAPPRPGTGRAATLEVAVSPGGRLR